MSSCEDSELWITYQQNSRGGKTATTQLIELEFQSHKLNDLEDVLDHVFCQGWVDARFRSIAWWEKHNGTKLKNSTCIETLLKEGVGKCESSSLKLIIADCAPVLWISYVFLKCPNSHSAVQRINLSDAADPCGKLERLAHVTNYVFKKGFLPANVRSRVHWEDACRKHIEEHASVQYVLCERSVGKEEDKPLRLVIGWDSALVAEFPKPDADATFDLGLKTILPVTVEKFYPQERAGSSIANCSPPAGVKSTAFGSTTPSIFFEAPPSRVSDSFPTASPTTSASFKTPPSTTSVSLFAIASDQSHKTFYLIFLGTILFFSWTAVLYPRVCGCVCERCRMQ